MARRLVKVAYCDRCPVGKEKRATETVVLSLGKSSTKLHLCDRHNKDLERDYYAWARLGEDVVPAEPARPFGIDREAARRVADLRTVQWREDLANMPEKITATDATSKRAVDGLPYGAGDWTFTRHAMERMVERGVSALDALRAAVDPSIVRTSDKQADCMVHERGPAKVTVNPSTKEIVTVAVPDNYTRRAL